MGGPGNDVVALGNNLNAGDGWSDTISFLASDSGRDSVYGFEAHDVVWIDHQLSTAARTEALDLAIFLFFGV